MRTGPILSQQGAGERGLS